MSYTAVINHIQRVLNNCGDPVILIQTGIQTPHDSGQTSIEVHRVTILRQNNCCTIPTPTPSSKDNPANSYWINRIRISPSLADDYSKNDPFSDNEMQNMICTKLFLFGCFSNN